MPKYRVKDNHTPIKHSYIDSETKERVVKHLEAGDEVELSKEQARSMKGSLEPLDEEGKFETAAPAEEDYNTLADHEKEERLAAKEEALQDQIAAVQAQLVELRDAMEAKAAERAAQVEAKAQEAKEQSEFRQGERAEDRTAKKAERASQ